MLIYYKPPKHFVAAQTFDALFHHEWMKMNGACQGALCAVSVDKPSEVAGENTVLLVAEETGYRREQLLLSSMQR